MDRISGLMPQTGWSPLLSPATPKNAPATTVEPAATSADTDDGKSAGTDTQTAQDHAQTARFFSGIAAARVGVGEAQIEPVGPPPDPNAPSGPMPTFDVSPLEEAAARVMAVSAIAGDTDMAASEASEATETPESQGETPAQDSAIKGVASSQSGEAAKSAAMTQDAAPDTSAAQQWQTRPWPQTPQTSVPQLDVTR
ncbi:hypothetical protein [Thioclava sp.]|uniref:hypothetical protein n=1 Tax=Thioclava sp. TaxID=1933450 RepID=UPI003AA99697